MQENSFGRLLQYLRKSNKLVLARKGIDWTQKKVAHELGVSQRQYVAWENDETVPSAKDLKNIAALFSLDAATQDALYRAAAQVPPEIFEVPYLRNRFFTGRERYLKELRELLETDRIVALSGLGGLGKTQIALEYAYSSHQSHMYRTVLWVNAADKATLEADYGSLAQTLDLPEKDGAEQSIHIKAVTQWFATHTNWLLLMDNADELPIVRPFLPTKLRGHIVLTTRWQFPEKLATPLAIEAMEPDEGLAFLYTRSGIEQTAAEDVVGRHIVQALGGHALALEQAGAYIQETSIAFVDYLTLYEENRRSLLDQYGALGEENSEHPLSVAATFRTSLTKARELSPLAEDILYFCAFLQPDAIPEELFEYDESFKIDILAFNKGIAALQRYSLIKQNKQEKTFSVHRLMRAVLIDAISSDLQKQWRERVTEALYEAFPAEAFSDVGLSNSWQCDRLLPHIWVCVAWKKDESAPIAEAAVLFHQTAIYLSLRMQHVAAITLLDRALVIYEQCLGAEDVFTLRCMGDMTADYLLQHKYEQAEALCQRILAVHEKNVGAMIADTYFTVMGCFHMMYDGRPSFYEGWSEYQRALKQVDENLGSEHPDIAPLLYWIVVLLHEQRRHEQAEALYQRTLTIQEQRLGETHPYIKSTKRAYEAILYSFGRGPKPW